MDLNRKNNIAVGRSGEDLAINYLLKKNYKILKRNLFCRYGEIDILARDKETTVLVEVKTVRGEKFGLAEDLVRFQKQLKLKKLALFISQKMACDDIRIDVIAINISGQSVKINHIKNAVY